MDARSSFAAALGIATTDVQPKPAMNESRADTSTDIQKAFAELEQTLGVEALDKLISPKDRERTNADPELARRFVRNLGGWREHYKKTDAAAALARAKVESDELEAERGRIINLARVAAADPALRANGDPTAASVQPEQPEPEPSAPQSPNPRATIADFIRRNFF